MQQILIRTCTQQDIAAVVHLERLWEREAIAYGDFNPMTQEAFLRILERFPAYFLVAESDRQLVGYIYGSVQRTKPIAVIPAQEPYVEIEDRYVHPDYRNRNIGGQLLERLFEIARHAGIARFVVGTASTDTERNLKFYRSHGFTAWSIQLFK